MAVCAIMTLTTNNLGNSEAGIPVLRKNSDFSSDHLKQHYVTFRQLFWTTIDSEDKAGTTTNYCWKTVLVSQRFLSHSALIQKSLNHIELGVPSTLIRTTQVAETSTYLQLEYQMPSICSFKKKHPLSSTSQGCAWEKTR
ncbi:hypothetical protein E2P81_ATG10066 [Venturia nashicola]|nr:hypothetical protein E2P81_ATG10066 [Venturia nashicola]